MINELKDRARQEHRCDTCRHFLGVPTFATIKDGVYDFRCSRAEAILGGPWILGERAYCMVQILGCESWECIEKPHTKSCFGFDLGEGV